MNHCLPKLLPCFSALTIMLQCLNLPAQAQFSMPTGLPLHSVNQQPILPRSTIARNQIISMLCEMKTDQNKDSLQNLLLRFEDRMQKLGKDQQITECYELVSKALNEYKTNGDLSGAMLCQHLIIELSDPSTVAQGDHNTCALAALQILFYYEEPSRLCDLVFQAHAGKISLPNGRIILMPENNIAPDLEARNFGPKTWFRSYAGQLFQVAAANVYWQSQVRDTHGNKVPLGSINYVQDYPDDSPYNADTKERVITKWAPEVTEILMCDQGSPESSPNFTFKTIADTYKLLGGQRRSCFMLSCTKSGKTEPSIPFASENDLAKKLQHLKNMNSLPALIAVNGYKISAFIRGKSPLLGWIATNPPSHVVCIDNYDPSKTNVSIHNSWGPGGSKQLNIHDLYLAAQ